MNDNLLQQAAEFYKSGEKKQALEILSQLVKQEPRNPDVWYGLALCVERNDTKLYCMKKVLEINPNHQKAKQVVEKLSSIIKPDEVIQPGFNANSKLEGLPEAGQTVQDELQKPIVTENTIQNGLIVNTEESNTNADLLQRAISFAKSGDNKSAGELLEWLVKQEPNNEIAWLWLAACKNKRDEKRYCLYKVLEINPANQNAKESLDKLRIEEPSVTELTQSSVINNRPISNRSAVQSVIQKQPPKRKKNSIVTCLAGIGLIILIIACLLSVLNGTGNQSSGSSNPTKAVDSGANIPSKPSVSTGEDHQISGDHWFGCSDREYFTKLVDYVVDQDKQAFQDALTYGLLDGTCIMFNNGDVVFITDTAIFSGLVKVRLKGELQEYWTNLEAIQ